MTEWLAAWRYNRAFRLRNRLDVGDELLRSELWATSVAFQMLGVSDTTEVCNIPGVDQWHQGHANPLSTDWRAKPLITMEGSVGAGKSTMAMENLRLFSYFTRPYNYIPDGIYLLNESIKSWQLSDLQKYHAAAELASHLAFFHWGRSGLNYRASLKERGDLDQLAFRRAHLLTGTLRSDYLQKRLEVGDYFLGPAYAPLDRIAPIAGDVIMDFIIKQWMPNGINDLEGMMQTASSLVHSDIVVMFLIRPDLMARRRNKDYSRKRFLLWKELYRQTVRLHYEIISGKINVPHYYCFNAEGPLYKNQLHFNRIMDESINYIEGRPKLFSI